MYQKTMRGLSAKKSDVAHSKKILLIFSATQFLLLDISFGSDNIAESNNKNTIKHLSVPPRYLYYHIQNIVDPLFC